MTTVVQAVYKNGVFTPARRLDIPNHEKVCLLAMPLTTWKKEFSGLLGGVRRRTGSRSAAEIERDITSASRTSRRK